MQHCPDGGNCCGLEHLDAPAVSGTFPPSGGLLEWCAAGDTVFVKSNAAEQGVTHDWKNSFAFDAGRCSDLHLQLFGCDSPWKIVDGSASAGTGGIGADADSDSAAPQDVLL